MNYRVICTFADLQDSDYVYRVGDNYPRGNTKVAKERIEELLGSRNKIGKPLIEIFERNSASCEHEEKNECAYTKTEINRLSTAELRDVAKQNGIENADEITGAELKKILIEKFSL